MSTFKIPQDAFTQELQAIGRMIDKDQLRKAATALNMARAARPAGARVLLVGMQVPPNYGANYTRQFAEVFENVAQERKAALVPFLLKGVADGPDPTALFQPDRIHPTAQAHPRMLDNVWPALRALL